MFDLLQPAAWNKDAEIGQFPKNLFFPDTIIVKTFKIAFNASGYFNLIVNEIHGIFGFCTSHHYWFMRENWYFGLRCVKPGIPD